MDDEHDVEVFERIPWESLEGKPDRRWVMYVAAGAVVLGAVGVSFGRQMAAPPPTAPTSPTASTSPTLASPPSSTVPATIPPRAEQTHPTWTEADLMALPVESVERSAVAVAEWFVVDFFTRDDPGGDRSFVEWARAWELEWLASDRMHVTVVVRRLAASGEEPYQRLEAEAWEVEVELGEDGGWAVAQGPSRADPPELVALQPDHENDQEASAGEEWVDPAGLTWSVGPLSETEEGGR
ncbi:MAG: hypothetical protein ACLFWM_00375 [Actinomycetota bacterium]